MIAKYLAEHPEGVIPTGLSFTPSTSTYERHQDHPAYWSNTEEIKKCQNFVEVTGETGDVILLHPVSSIPIFRLSDIYLYARIEAHAAFGIEESYADSSYHHKSPSSLEGSVRFQPKKS
jgi:hypothetical protein